MIPVSIASLSVDSASNQPVVILRPIAEEGVDGRLVPIWIGQNEATAILLALQDIAPPRPMTHDLLKVVIETLGAEVQRVEITRIEGGTFYASIWLSGPGDFVHQLDARPSDSIALAVRSGAPIFISEQVLDEVAVVEVTEEDEEEQVERFREFLEGVDPSDFQG
ncbi:MAG: bifunctional nuclease family protein [Coriobacteriia bacterium]|jgi:bifunctional DNase/RNase|nr:bifunctional nuclease family protein [Coriobacteriia bacterium]